VRAGPLRAESGRPPPQGCPEAPPSISWEQMIVARTSDRSDSEEEGTDCWSLCFLCARFWLKSPPPAFSGDTPVTDDVCMQALQPDPSFSLTAHSIRPVSGPAGLAGGEVALPRLILHHESLGPVRLCLTLPQSFSTYIGSRDPGLCAAGKLGGQQCGSGLLTAPATGLGSQPDSPTTTNILRC